MDGDTIHGRIGKHRERVRDIGVHAPEIPHAARGGRRCEYIEKVRRFAAEEGIEIPNPSKVDI